LKTLTSQQALADAANFLKQYIANNPEYQVKYQQTQTTLIICYLLNQDIFFYFNRVPVLLYLVVHMVEV